MFVDTAPPEPHPGPVITLQRNGDPARKVDVLLIGDGYTAAERGKFEADARRLMEILFATSPFKERRTDFNVWGLAPAARESGVSRPSQGIHRASPVAATYDAFGSERYVLTFDNKAFRRVASYAPYDVVEIVTNTRTYGGGGIYNLYSTVAADNAFSPYVFVHEFAHHFAALADEYYTSPVAYLPSETREEPWEANITATPASPKWKDLVEAGTPLPTPWQKQDYETRSRAAQAKRAEIRKQNRPESDMEALFQEERQMDQRQFPAEKFFGKVGAFEGARYEAQGFYRPEVDCIMFTRSEQFCAVCRRALARVIDTYVQIGHGTKTRRTRRTRNRVLRGTRYPSCPSCLVASWCLLVSSPHEVAGQGRACELSLLAVRRGWDDGLVRRQESGGAEEPPRDEARRQGLLLPHRQREGGGRRREGRKRAPAGSQRQGR